MSGACFGTGTKTRSTWICSRRTTSCATRTSCARAAPTSADAAIEDSPSGRCVRRAASTAAIAKGRCGPDGTLGIVQLGGHACRLSRRSAARRPARATSSSPSPRRISCIGSIVTDDGAGRLRGAERVSERAEFLTSTRRALPAREPALRARRDALRRRHVSRHHSAPGVSVGVSEELTSVANQLEQPVRPRAHLSRRARIDRRRRGSPRCRSGRQRALVELLSHPNGWWRDTAQRLLVERGDASVVPALGERAAARPSGGRALHALWTLDGLDALDVETLTGALADASPHVRAAAVRLSEPWLREPGPRASAARGGVEAGETTRRRRSGVRWR